MKHLLSLSRLLFVLLLSFFCLLPANAQDEETIRQAMYTTAELISSGNIDGLDALLAPDYVLHSPLGDADSAGLKGLLSALSNAMTGFTLGREAVMVEGNMATTRTMLTGVFENDFVGPMGVLPPTGQPFALEVINIFRFDEAGLIAEEWAQFDNLSFMTQLGAMGNPSPAVSQEMADAFAARFDEIFNGAGGNLDIIDEIFTPEFITHQPFGLVIDRENFKGYIAGYYLAIPDLQQEVNHVYVAGEYVILHVTYTGTHQGDLFGVAATGNPIAFDGIGIFKMNAEGLAVENWASLNFLDMLVQVGGFAMPE